MLILFVLHVHNNLWHMLCMNSFGWCCLPFKIIFKKKYLSLVHIYRLLNPLSLVGNNLVWRVSASVCVWVCAFIFSCMQIQCPCKINITFSNMHLCCCRYKLTTVYCILLTVNVNNCMYCMQTSHLFVCALYMIS